MYLWCTIQQLNMLHLNTHIFKHKNTGCNTIFIARKSRKIFQNMKMYITDNKTNRSFITKKYFSRKVLIFPDFLDIQSKFHDFSVKKGPFSNSLIIPRFPWFPGWLWTLWGNSYSLKNNNNNKWEEPIFSA